jgi:hypothetical protein
MLSRLAYVLARAHARRWLPSACLLAVAALLPTLAVAQQVDSVARKDSTPRLGLGASSALTVHSGVGQIKHAALGIESGAALDLGWIGSRKVRLSVGVDYLSMTIDRPDSLGLRESGGGYVFTAFTDVTLLPSLSRRLSPYGGVGFGVDAVGTTVSNEQIGAMYNTNVLDVHAQVGTLYRITPRGRLQLEVRGTGARVVRRVSVRLGYTWLYNGLP